MVTVVIASYIENEHVERIRSLDERLQVLYDPELVPPPRGRLRFLYDPKQLPAACWSEDQPGEGWQRTPEEEERWLGMLGEAEVLYDFDAKTLEDLPKLSPKLRWVQATAAGAGEVVARAGLQKTDIVVTTASGVFSSPLAEFAMMAILAHVKELFRLQADKRERLWRAAPAETLAAKTLCILGLGSIGRAVAERVRPFGARILGIKRDMGPENTARGFADEVYTPENLKQALGESDYVVATLPHTPETHHLIDSAAIAAMKPGAYFVNVGRGQVVDEEALVEALRSGHLSGAALDVFETEPLPQENPLWDLENVIVSPHTTALVPSLSTEHLTDLFCENLRRYLERRPLINKLDKQGLY